MSFPNISSSTALHAAEAIAIGAVGGSLATWLGLPAGYLTGAMIFVAIASLAGRQLVIPHPVLDLATVFLGIALGGIVSPDLLQGLSAYLPSLALFTVSTFSVVAASILYLRYVHGWDIQSALFASIPGAIGQVMVLAFDAKADHVGVAIVQTLRLLALTVVMPLFIVAIGFSPDLAAMNRPVSDPTGIAILIALAFPVGYGLGLLRFPSPWIFGGMLASGLLHGFGFVQGGLPNSVNSLAMIVIGATMGSRFSSIGRSAFLGYLVAGLGSMLVTFAVAGAFGFATVALLPVKAADVFVAFAPGALDVMMALALALHLDPIYVGVHHTLRFLFVAVLTPFVARALPKRKVAPATVASPARPKDALPKDIDPLDD